MDQPVGRVIFVDDDPQVLAGLKSRLWGLRRMWHLTFVPSGEAALAEMGQQRFDAIISDMRMPVMDGAQLLTEVARRHPETDRIVLSGQSDATASVRALAVAHRFLSKPCPPGQLEAVLNEIAARRGRPTGHLRVSGVD